ncbi:MAG TPA: hypothetical protein VGS07_06605 [Thermoanaerobaculia bacterium]|jgi:hypothetical protein|nr:hypothetical protein [Thermoanaerobaculia bacterium]
MSRLGIDRSGCTGWGRVFFVALCLALAVIFPGCWEQRIWRRAGDFVGRLRCGMSSSDVEQMAKAYKGLRPEVKEPGSLVLWKGNTMIEAKFDPNGLRRVQVTWIDTIMHVKSLPKKDLCEPRQKDQQ